MSIILILVVIALIVRVAMHFGLIKGKTKDKQSVKKKSDPKARTEIGVKQDVNGRSLKNQLMTVMVFTKLNTRRFFRDRLAQFFSILFPLIFLFVFGSLSKSGSSISLNVAVVNNSQTSFSKSFVKDINNDKLFKVDKTSSTLSEAKSKLSKSQIDGIIVLPQNFGATKSGQNNPSGQVQVLYSENSTDAGTALSTVVTSALKSVNARYVSSYQPFTVNAQVVKQKSLTSFDYTFSGLLGFSIIGLGIFGPVNVFPELKKQGVLRRLHTTPLRVWQFFLSTMLSQALTGIIAIAIQFAVAIKIFNLKVDGNYLDIAVFIILSIFMILGLSLAIGGWAKNERQAAPLSNIVVFPMLFLSGTFFPRYIMPDWLQKVTNFLPLTPVIDGLRYLTTEGKNLTQIGPQLGLMAAWFIVIYAIAFRVFKWE
jgi:ABC-2 type transport system permease protein